MPYVHIETDVWLSAQEMREAGASYSKEEWHRLERFVAEARRAVDALFDAGQTERAKALFEAGRGVRELLQLDGKWDALKADVAYTKWLAERDAALAA